MKIGIFTIFAVPNYGALLQSHALSSWLASEGHDAKVIDYRQPALEQYFKFRWSFPPAIHHWNRLRKCASFVDNKIRLASPTIRSAKEFEVLANEYDAFVTGSDQVWFTGPVQYFDSLYFLDFKAPSARKISYAASAGGTTDFGEYEGRVRNALGGFHRIGVRDAHTRSMIAPLTEKPITETVDPVFLYDFNDLDDCGVSESEPYLLVFGDFQGEFASVVRDVQEATGLKRVVSLQYHQTFAHERVASPSPAEWLSWIKHAAFVLTSYFHGTVVAVKYQRPFISLPTAGRKLKVSTLLEPLCLGSRCMHKTPSLDEIKEILAIDINWSDVGRILRSKIDESKRFLTSSLAN